MEAITGNLKIGMTFEAEKIVQPEDSAARYDSGLVDVFSTPALIAFMESTAYRCVQPYLPDGFSTVGTEVHVQHLKATPIGMKVRCHATLTHIDGKKLVFELKAWDEENLIGQGTHHRYIIHMQKFIEKITNG